MFNTYQGFASASYNLLQVISNQNKGREAYSNLLCYCIRFHPKLKYDPALNADIVHIFPEEVPYTNDWTFGDIVADLKQRLLEDDNL